MNAMSKIALAALAAVALTPFAAYAEKVKSHLSDALVAGQRRHAGEGRQRLCQRPSGRFDLLSRRPVRRPPDDVARLRRRLERRHHGQHLQRLAARPREGQAHRADSRRDGTEVKADWPAGIVGASSAGGALYGFPNEIDVYALNYNKKLFEPTPASRPRPPPGTNSSPTPRRSPTRPRASRDFGLINSWTAGVIHPFASLLASNGGQLVADGKPRSTARRRRRLSRSMKSS